MKKSISVFLLFVVSLGIALGQVNSKKAISHRQKVSLDQVTKFIQLEARVKEAKSITMTNGIVLLKESFEEGIPVNWFQNIYSGNGMWVSFTGGDRMIPHTDGNYIAADSDHDRLAIFDVGLFTN